MILYEIAFLLYILFNPVECIVQRLWEAIKWQGNRILTIQCFGTKAEAHWGTVQLDGDFLRGPGGVAFTVSLSPQII